MDYSPEKFKKDFVEFLNMNDANGPNLQPWQMDIVNRMMTDFALCTQQPLPTISYTSDICKPCPEPCKTYGSKCVPKEENKPMASYASATVVSAESIETSQRSIVRDTLRTAVERLKIALKKEFGLIDDEAPQTPTELVERIAAGKYTIDKEYADYKSWGPEGAVRYVRWRDPAVAEDKAGYKTARAQLDDAYEDAKLKSALLPVADLLQLVEDFKAWKHA